MTPIQKAQSYVGEKETGGKNRSPNIDRWLKNCKTAVGNPWCSAYVCSMFLEAGTPLPIMTAGSQALKAWGKKNGLLFTDPNKLKDCKSAIFGWTNADKIHGHVGLVQKRFVDSDGEVVAIGTVEGNTNGGGSRNGDGVYNLRRGVPVDGRHKLWFVDTSKIAQWW